ncbi:Phospholipase A2 group XV (1-O-acylceramide synthase) (ACS) (LCAT-like lysophospholipase) (LLPL) (Lysophospholipase 3) (Lysosomal phospholipase A and acyltransferase) (Lysosomal phospholipase A2) (LPLA2) [Durusdinium trenchii]|uniref:Uncharacterized protein n=1 Tax=Durusdinium trenchii TaxID=1381693 RepID=A0ABP0PB70_9DINO
MGQQASAESEHLEKGVKSVVLIHGLASCALMGRTAEGTAAFVCDNCTADSVSEHLVYVSISELIEHPTIVKTLGLSWEEASSRGVKTMKTSCGYENILVTPVEGLDGIRNLNPGLAEATITPIQLWHTVIEHLNDFNLFAINYDWRQWGDLTYIEHYVEKFRENMENAVRVSKQPVVIIAHSLGAQVVTYMMGFLGPAWTQAHVSDVVLMGPATMGSPSVFAAYANGPSTITHSTAIPVVNFLEQRLRDVASTWAGLLSVMPTTMAGIDPFAREKMASSPQRSYGATDCVSFLQDLAACEDDSEDLIHVDDHTQTWLQENDILSAPRTWTKQFQNAAVMRQGFEQHVVPFLKPPNCRVHVVFSDGIDTLTISEFESNLYKKAKFTRSDKGDDTITAKSVQNMVTAWKTAGVHIHTHNAGKVHHKDLIMSPFTMRVLDHVMAQDAAFFDSDSEESEEGWCTG